MVMPILNAGTSKAKVGGDFTHGKFALSLHAALQSMEPFQKSQRPSVLDTLPSDESSTLQPKRDFQPYHAQSVPRPANLHSSAEPSDVQVTTMMFRNIPYKYTQNMLLREIDESGFADTYNFFYLPMDVHNRSNVGYAFINFEKHEDAERFRDVFADHRFQIFNSRKIGGVCTAHVQGLEENVRHFENRAVTVARNDQYRPIVLKARQRMDFEDVVAEVNAAGVLSGSRAPVAGIADARQGLEAAIRELLASSADSTPSVGAASPCRGVTPEYASPPAALLPPPVPLDEPAYVPLPVSVTKGLFLEDSSSDGCRSRASSGQTPRTNGLILGALLNTHLASDPVWCVA